MANWKKIGTGVGVVVVAGAAVAGIMTWQKMDTSRSDVADDQTRLADFKATDEAAIKRGEYVMRLGDCMACHTENFSGGYTIDTPFGKLLTSNITPDQDTGIGNMTERDFFNALRQGIGSNGLIYPAMPYPAYSKLSDDDLHDLWAYMSTLKPVSKEIDENGQMPFPFNLRVAMAGWNLLFFNNEGFEPDTTKSDDWNRGKYIVDGPAHCGTCHTPVNLLGAAETGDDVYLSGNRIGAWYAPDITPNPHTGIGDDSPEQVMAYLKTGSDGTSMASGPMAEAVEHSTQYFTDEDLAAVANYLHSIPPSKGEKQPVMTRSDEQQQKGDLAYEVNCAACHGVQGEGMGSVAPAFAGNNALLADDATNLIHVMLKGAKAAHTESRPTGAGMPSFAWKMDDQEIADVLDHIRNSWGNSAKPVSVERVAEMRKQLEARDKLDTPQQRAAQQQ